WPTPARSRSGTRARLWRWRTRPDRPRIARWRNASSAAQLDHERDPGVEPVAVERLDLLPRGKPAQVQGALVVVDQVDRLADRLPRVFELDWVVDLSRDPRIVPAADSQLHVRVGAQVPDPGRDGVGTLDRERWRAKLDEEHLLSPSDCPDAFAP